MHATNDTSDNAPASPGDQPPLGVDLYCPECGYNLRGLTSRRCPECGLVLDFIESDTPIIPWERRHELGRFRAYWQTVLMVMFRNRLFCRAAYRPVSYRDSQRFRWVCILHVLIPLILALPILWAFEFEPLTDTVTSFGVGFIPVVCVCLVATLLALTGLPSYFFHPKTLPVDRQNRAVALSYYGFSALALAPLGLAGLPASYAAENWPHGLDLVFDLLTVLWLPTLLTLCWLDLIGLARRSLRHPWAVLQVAILVPASWVVFGALLLYTLPVLIIYVLIIVYSLW